MIDELYRLAGIYNTCILCVLHFVPNGLKLRGHLGSELQRKAATILSIEKDEEPTQSVVKALKVRDGSPLDVPLMLFAWDKEAGMHVYKGEKPREEKEKRKERELVNVARDIFGRQTLQVRQVLTQSKFQATLLLQSTSGCHSAMLLTHSEAQFQVTAISLK